MTGAPRRGLETRHCRGNHASLADCGLSFTKTPQPIVTTATNQGQQQQQHLGTQSRPAPDRERLEDIRVQLHCKQLNPEIVCTKARSNVLFDRIITSYKKEAKVRVGSGKW